MAVSWITPAGDLGTLDEKNTIEIELDAVSDSNGVSFSIIAGNLPRGLRLENNLIKGSPTEVNKKTQSKFVIRAFDGSDLKDRTFSLFIEGSDVPEWVTEEGFLKVGNGDNYFVLDNSYVEFQLEAEDTDELAGDVLEYYLVPNTGTLPPGLSLSSTGLISGFTDPIFSVIYSNNLTGAYDTASYDILPLDRPDADTNGFDTFLYDSETFDYSEDAAFPTRLSRFYSFVIAVTDGIHEIRRVFRIWVVTEDFLKSDNAIVQVDSNLFRADNSDFRLPIWITESYLGRYRANNYITIFLDVYNPPSLPGTISYLLVTNPGTYKNKTTGEIIYNGRYEISRRYPDFVQSNVVLTDPDDWEVIVPETESSFPPGMELDTSTGDVAGRVPYQNAVTVPYKFTLRAISYPLNLLKKDLSVVTNWNNAITYVENDVVIYKEIFYVCVQLNKNKVPTLNNLYWVQVTASAEKTFTIDIVGELESAIEWITDSDLGILKPNQPSKVSVLANSMIYGNTVRYSITKGSLPPGLELIGNGLITGKVKQFADSSGLGLTRFYERDSSEIDSTGTFSYNVLWDTGSTSFDKVYNFSIIAKDYANSSESEKDFFITIQADSTKTFANLYLIALQKKQKRLDWFNFITNSDIFRSDEIYRYGDRNFGIQDEIKVLLYAGIESVEAVKYVQAMSRNHYRKRIRLGKVKSAEAKDPSTQEVIYEVVYVDVIDEYEKNGKSISNEIHLADDIESKVLVSYDSIKIDSDIPLVSDSDHQRIFPNSFKNMRKRIKAIGERDREFLPLWMRSIQQNSAVEPGYVKALLLCFTKPGKAASIILRINNSDFDFTSINFEVDRYLIDVLEGEIENKYLAFPQRGEKLP